MKPLINTQLFKFSIVHFILFLLLIGIFVASCSKSTSNEITSVPVIDRISIKDEKLNITNITFLEAKKNLFDSSDPKYSQVIGDVPMENTNALISKLELYFNVELENKNSIPKYITIFTDNSSDKLNPYEDVQLSKAKGISLFSIKAGQLEHKFYTVANKTLIENKKLKVATDYFIINDMNFLGYSIFSSPSLKWNMFIITGTPNLTGKPNGDVNPKRDLNNFTETVSGIAGMKLTSSSSCASCNGSFGTCTGAGNMQCCGNCDEPISCGVTAVNTMRALNGSSQLDATQAYYTRDNFLSVGVVGNAGTYYANAYYYISETGLSNGALTSSNLTQHFNLGIKTQAAANVMQSGGKFDIVYDEQYKTEALAMISHYRTLSQDAKFHRYLDKLTYDLNRFVGKTPGYIKNVLNNQPYSTSE